MCGVAGVVNFKGEPINVDKLSVMTDFIAHRGPDGHGVYCKGPIGLGHRRLAIIDISPTGKQPMSNSDETIWITYNGEIYNYLEIREELVQKGYRFRSESDTEVVIYAYQEWGTRCLEKFNGMFAFAIWDEEKRRVFIARDRIGIKPLFYYLTNEKLVFGSEIKALLPEVSQKLEIDHEALSYYLALNYVPAPFTLFKSVQQLMPGHFMVVNLDGGVKIEKYWSLEYQENNYKKEEEYLEELEELLNDAVKIRLMSDVPFGAFLSGGLDSSAISYLMAQNLSAKLKTFGIGFSENAFNELGYADEVAASLGVDLYSRTLKPDMDVTEVLPKMVWHAEEPTANSSMLAVYHLSQLTREHATMVLSGDGADEIFAGYETYQAYYIHKSYRMIPTVLQEHIISPLVNLLPVSEKKVGFDFKMRRFIKAGRLNSDEAHASWRMIFDAEGRKRILADNIPHYDMFNLYRQVFAETNARHSLNRMLYADTTFYLPNDALVKIDRMSMAHGLETRVPFLDHRMVEFAAKVPPNLKLRNFTNRKFLLKAVMQDKLPGNIINRKKAGFNIPKSQWIREGLKPFVTDHLSKPQIDKMGFLNFKEVEALLDDHYKFKADNSFQIWNLLTLSLWWQQFMEAR